MTNEIKRLLKQSFNKVKWTKHIRGLEKLPEGPSDIINTQHYLYCWALFSKLTLPERQKFLADPKNKQFSERMDQIAQGISLETAELVSELILDQFKVQHKLRSKL